MTGTVYKSTGSWYAVKAADGLFYKARLKGKLRIGGITSTNPIAVGDVIDMKLEDETERSCIISRIHDRKNYITRQSPHNKHQHHIIASNIDQSYLFATLRDPKTSLGFIDRFLITSEAYHIQSVIIYNKVDLYDEQDMKRLEELTEIYERIGYKVASVSVQQNIGIAAIKESLRNKVTLLSGHSGVGKSTFINKLFPELDLKTQEVSEWSGKGLHTTTFAEMFDLEIGGKIIDTPGLREFALMDIPKEELAHYFPEMRALIHYCKFNNCIHTSEPGCAIKNALNEGHISEERYVSYLTILDSIGEKKNND
ncbi:ribosome small subunit-dependent GTPase A [soil metagenome]